MPRPRLRPAAAFLLALTVVAPTLGCDKKELVETTFPSEGVELRYDLQPGASFEGLVRRRETVSSRGQTMNRSITFSVALSVTGAEADGTARVAAKIHNIELNWNVPGLPISLDEFNKKARDRLNGMTIRFAVKPDGTVDIPPLPPDFGDAETGVLESVVDGLTAAFFVLPGERLVAGGGWEDGSTRGRKDKLGKYVEESLRGKVIGMFERRTKDKAHTVLKLAIHTDKTETTTTKDGSTEIRTRSDTTVLFDPTDGSMVSIESEQTRTQGATTTKANFNARWTRTGAGVGVATISPDPPPTEKPEVQTITDPCDDDYVGADECLDPCNSNYMGDDPCPAAESAGDAG